MSNDRCVPAAGVRALTPLYDTSVRVAMRENVWRRQMLAHVVETGAATVLDVGCGTGTLAVMLARRMPDARVIGLDGDPEILSRARRRASDTGVNVELVLGLADAIPMEDGSVDCVVSSLVFHHLMPSAKQRALAEMRRVLTPGGRFVVADFGRPHGPVMRLAFAVIQLLDGFENTRQHAAGELPALIEHAGFQVDTLSRLRTGFGTLDILAADR